MIKDNIKNAKNYYDLSERVRLGLEYLVNTDFSVIKNGKYEILGNEVFAIVQDYFSKPPEECKFEAHKKYIDIQYILEGEEKIGISDIKNFFDSIEYDEERDIVFLSLKTDEMPDFIDMKEKDFAIFTPKDAHMPSIAVKTPSFVRKAVVKVKS
ncbi:MAG: YhcH/YjgK/YiaL family protein [Candidatus Gastranaerophilaceae bacterium]